VLRNAEQRAVLAPPACSSWPGPGAVGRSDATPGQRTAEGVEVAVDGGRGVDEQVGAE